MDESKLPETGVEPAPPDSSRPKNSGLAIASLVLAFILGPLGILLGIIAMIRIGRDPTRLRGMGLALGGVIVGTFWAFAAMIALMFVPTFMRSGAGRFDSISCEINVESLSKAMTMYSQDYDGDYPPAERWVAALESYDVSRSDFTCPKARGKLPTYAMNRRIGGMKHRTIKYPADTVLLFESVPGENPTGGPELFPKQPRHKGGYVVAFVDGNVRTVEQSLLGRLNFDPTPASKPKGLPRPPSG